MLGSGARANAPPSSTRDELLNAVEIVKVWPSLVRLVPVVPTRARVCLACEPYDPMTERLSCNQLRLFLDRPRPGAFAWVVSFDQGYPHIPLRSLKIVRMCLPSESAVFANTCQWGLYAATRTAIRGLKAADIFLLHKRSLPQSQCRNAGG
eukprot:1191248-Prorocentrum_minimum.AAC.1